MLLHDDVDVHLNYANVLCQLDGFQRAMDHLGAAMRVPGGDATGAGAARREVWEFVSRVSEFIASRAGCKPKQLASLAAELPVPSGAVRLLSELAVGDNPGTTVVVKVVAALPNSGIYASKHLRFVVIDGREQLSCASLYGLPKGLVQVNATLELAAPHLLQVEAGHWDGPAQVAGFQILRIEEPKAQLKVNGCGVVPRAERGKASQ